MKRILAITAGFALAGAFVGGIVGAIVAIIPVRGAGPGINWQIIGLGWSFGAALGLVLGPVAAWTLMRQVPIWRAILETALGTAVGAVAGLAIEWVGGPGFSMLAGALMGFAAAAVRLRLAHRAPVRR